MRSTGPSRLRPALFLALTSGCAAGTAQRGGAPSGVALSCAPPDAEVWVDGVPRGLCSDFGARGPLLALEPGLRRIEVAKPGYEPWERLVDAGGSRVALSAALVAPAPARVTAPPGPQ